MPLGYYIDSELEVPNDQSGHRLDRIGDTATGYLRCSPGTRTAEAFGVHAATDCAVSKDGITFTATTYSRSGVSGVLRRLH